MLIRLAVVILCRRLYWRQQGVADLDEFFASHLLCYPPLALCILENGVPLKYDTIMYMQFLSKLGLGFCLSTYLPPANEVCEGYVFTGVCLSTGGGRGVSVTVQRGISVQGGLCQGRLVSVKVGGLCPGCLCQGGGLCTGVRGLCPGGPCQGSGVSVQGVPVRGLCPGGGGLCPGGGDLCPGARGLCPGDGSSSLSGGSVSVWGECLCLGVSVRESLYGGGSLSRRGSLSRGRGSLSRGGESVQGGLCLGECLSLGVSVHGGSLSTEGLCPGGLCIGGSLSGRTPDRAPPPCMVTSGRYGYCNAFLFPNEISTFRFLTFIDFWKLYSSRNTDIIIHQGLVPIRDYKSFLIR